MRDITGQRFGRLEVLEKTDARSGCNIVWKCLCSCGNICHVSGVKLRNGHTQSCGCKHDETARKTMLQLRETRPYVDGTDVYLISKMTVRKDNKTGTRGVHWDKGSGCYRAMITFKNKTYGLGRYRDLEKAKEARKLAEEKVFEEFLEWYYEKFPFPRNQNIESGK